jgi:hypothetical protein
MAYMSADPMNRPGWEDFPQYSVEIVSPQLPCGAGWLGNCLMELGVSLWQPWDRPTNHLWQRIEPYRYRFVDRQDRVSTWRQTLPALKAGRVFEFKPDLVPKISHRRQRLLPADHKLIFFVRDPRDALYSEWRRQCANSGKSNSEFTDFLAASFHNQPFSNLQYLHAFLTDWQESLAGTSHIVLRFEDYRLAPYDTLTRALDYFSLDCPEEQVRAALRASDFRVGKLIEEQREVAGVLKSRLYRAGVPLEYKQTYTPKMLRCFSPDFDSLFEWLGYETF